MRTCVNVLGDASACVVVENSEKGSTAVLDKGQTV
jgi:Na+/H+-dicarboxylate symporter